MWINFPRIEGSTRDVKVQRRQEPQADQTTAAAVCQAQYRRRHVAQSPLLYHTHGTINRSTLPSQVLRFSGQKLHSLLSDCCRISLCGNRRKKVLSAPNIRVHGENILRQLGSLQRRTSMPIMPKRSFVLCAANVPPFAVRPICMPKPPQDCRGCYGCTGSCTISFGSILPPEQFPRSLWASSRGGCPCRKFSRFKWHKR